jgi:hypothetical protein
VEGSAARPDPDSFGCSGQAASRARSCGACAAGTQMGRWGLQEDVKESSQRLKESSQHVKQSSPDVEKSSHVLEELPAVLRILSRDGSGSKSVLHESFHVVFPSRPVASGSRDDRFESRA